MILNTCCGHADAFPITAASPASLPQPQDKRELQLGFDLVSLGLMTPGTQAKSHGMELSPWYRNKTKEFPLPLGTMSLPDFHHDPDSSNHPHKACLKGNQSQHPFYRPVSSLLFRESPGLLGRHTLSAKLRL